MLFRDKHFAIQALQVLNERGPLRGVELLRATGYTDACEQPDDMEVGPVKGIRKALRLCTLFNCVDEGILYAKYDDGHSGCEHTIFNITMAGERVLEKGRQCG